MTWNTRWDLKSAFKDGNRKMHGNSIFRLGACFNSPISERIGFSYQSSNIFLDNLSFDNAQFVGSDHKVEVRTNPVNLETLLLNSCNLML